MREVVATVAEAAPPDERRLRGAAIGFAAMAVPATTIPNAPIAERLGVDPGWIETRTGIRERRALRGDERVSDLATEAGECALAKAGAACTAFIAALQVTSAQLESGRASKALVIGVDALHSFLNPDDRRTAALFGDGAGAVVMTATAEGRMGPILMRSECAPDMIRIPRGGTLEMRGHETFVNAVARISEVTLEVLDRAGLTLDEVDLFVYHQANSRIIAAVGDKLGLPAERVIDCIASYGNTSAASIPIALAEAEQDGRLKPGMRVLAAAFGAGFTWGGALMEWGLSDAA